MSKNLDEFYKQDKKKQKKESLDAFFGNDFTPYNPQKKKKKEIKLDDVFDNTRELKKENTLKEDDKQAIKVKQKNSKVNKQNEDEESYKGIKLNIPSLEDNKPFVEETKEESKEEVAEIKTTPKEELNASQDVFESQEDIKKDAPTERIIKTHIQETTQQVEEVDSNEDIEKENKENPSSAPVQEKEVQVVNEPIEELTKSVFDTPINEYEDTSEIEEEPLYEEEREIDKKATSKQEDLDDKNKKKNLLFGILAIVLALIGLVAYLVLNKEDTKEIETPVQSDTIYINLISDSATANYSDDLDLLTYVSSYTSGANISYTKLEHKLGEQKVTYTVSNNTEETTASLTLTLVDTEEPTFDLKEDSVTLNRSELDEFDCTEYVDFNSFKDNFDSSSELNFKAACPNLSSISSDKNGALIVYELSDSNGNVAQRTLEIKIINQGETDD